MRNNLTLDDILPNVEDGRILIQRAVQYTTQILVEEFPTFINLRHFVAIPDRSSSVYKSRIVPMKLLFRDEKYTNENIQILQQYSRECNLTGSPQV